MQKDIALQLIKVGNMDSRKKAAVFAATILLIFPHQARAQYETSVPFLLIAPDARSEGMGVTGTGLADDGSAIYWNPGGLGLLKGDHVTANISPWLPEFSSDLTYYFVGYSHYVKQWKSSFAASITYLDMPFFLYSINDPTVQLPWSLRDIAVTLGYGLQISNGLGLGANLRYLKSELSTFGSYSGLGSAKSSDLSADIGLLYRPQRLELPVIGHFDNRLGLGLTLTNFGPKFYYVDQAQTEPLPTNLRLGLSLHLIKSERHNLYFVLDVTRRMVHYFGGDSIGINPIDSSIVYSPRGFDSFPKSLITSWSNGSVLRSFTLNMGIEYWFGQPRTVALRLGYYKQYYDFGGRNLFTLGGGFRYKAFGLDVSYVSSFKGNEPLSNQMRFSLALNWGGESDF
jgi:hypothetical protein